MDIGNVTKAPGSTVKGLGAATMPIVNAIANVDIHSPLFWLNIVVAILSTVIGALSSGK